MAVFEQGDIIIVNFDPTVGHEPQKTRPALVVSNADYNISTSMTLVCPITSGPSRFFLHDNLPDSCSVKGCVVIEQVRAIDLAARGAHKVDELHGQPLEDILACLRSFF